MSESDSFSSLKALAASHLSKTCVQNDDTESGNGFTRRIPIPSLNGVQKGLSDTRLAFSPGRLPGLPSLSLSQSPIRSVLEEQLANRFKAQELKRKEEENAKLAESMKKLQVKEDFEIDLRMALEDGIRAKKLGSVPAQPIEELLSSSSSFESLFEPKFINCDDDNVIEKSPEPLLPCITDMSYILQQKIKRGKCSAFGKVLTSRLRPVAAPYLRENIDTNIVRFDFMTKSPCDLIKDKLRKPTMSSSFTFDINSFV